MRGGGGEKMTQEWVGCSGRSRRGGERVAGGEEW